MSRDTLLEAQAESTMERDKGEQLFLLYQLY